MKRVTLLVTLLAAGYAAGMGLPVPAVTHAQGAAQAAAPAGQAPGRAGASAPAADAARAAGPFIASCGRGRGNAPDGRCTDEPRAASNMFLLRGLPEARAELGKVRLFTREQQNASRTHLEWAPEYRLTASLRRGLKPGEKPPDQGELHTDNTQIYLVTGGSGSVLVEGKVAPEGEYLVAPGELRGGPITGGRVVKVSVGDLLSIPPYTWHIAYGDPGVDLQYVIIHIHTRQTIP